MKYVDRAKQQFRYLWFNYANLNGLVILIACVVAISWVFGTMSKIQENFDAQRALEQKNQQLQLAELEVQTLKYEQNYYNSDEYKELEARSKLGLASSGEKQLILPENSAAVQALDAKDNTSYVKNTSSSNSNISNESNLQQWMDFLSGKTAAAKLQK